MYIATIESYVCSKSSLLSACDRDRKKAKARAVSRRDLRSVPNDVMYVNELQRVIFSNLRRSSMTNVAPITRDNYPYDKPPKAALNFFHLAFVERSSQLSIACRIHT